jgi:hypothetical protein
MGVGVGRGVGVGVGTAVMVGPCPLLQAASVREQHCHAISHLRSPPFARAPLAPAGVPLR